MRSENFTISKYVGIILLRLENYQAMLWINIAQFHHLDLSFLPRYLVGAWITPVEASRKPQNERLAYKLVDCPTSCDSFTFVKP